MKKYTLKCFENFKCLADKCADSCCIGWGVDIDEKTCKFYKSLSGEFGAFVKENIDFNNSSVKMKENGRCPFLNEQNLCEIIINLGEDNISYICTNHPRFFNEFDTHEEFGFGLCCEESARLLFFREAILEEKIKNHNPLFFLRDELFKIIYENDFSLTEKIYCFLDMICEAEELLFWEREDEIIDFLRGYTPEKKGGLADIGGFLNVAKNTEPIDRKWENKLLKVTEKQDEIKKKLPNVIKLNEERYNKIFYYYIFRYLLKDIEERELVSKGKFIVFLVYMNIIFDTYSYLCEDKDYVKNTILISKQMEYSNENLEFIKEETFENPAFDFESMTGRG